MLPENWKEKHTPEEIEALNRFYDANDKDEGSPLRRWAEEANRKFGPSYSLRKTQDSGDIGDLGDSQRDVFIRSCYLAYSSVHSEDWPDAWVEQALGQLRRRRSPGDGSPQGEISHDGNSNEDEAQFPGYVYVIKDMQSGLIKIGRTESWIRRSRELCVDEDQIRMMNVRWVKNSYETEKYLHDRYKEYRLPQSEWFRLDHVPVI